MNENFNENLKKAIEAKRQVKGYCTVTVEHDWKIKVYAHPDSSKVHEAVAALTPLTGRMEKQEGFGSIDFCGENESFSTKVITLEECKILGYKLKKSSKPVMVESGEMEEVVEREAITDCAIRQGKYTKADIEVPA